MELYEKDADRAYSYTIDMRRYLLEGETVTGAVATISPVTDPAMGIVRMEYGADAVIVWLSGGQDEVRYVVATTVTTSGKRRWLIRFAIVTHGDAAPVEIVEISAEQLADSVGAGVIAQYAFAPSSVSFPATAVGATSAPIAVEVTNVGAEQASIQSITIGAPFTFTSDTSGRLAPGESFTLQVRFAPTIVGNRNATLVIDGNVAATLPLSGRAT
ncbi:choice-of-anchor D domain-containing protein [Sphingobium yanoikuyae]|nr:choice-of-anchor D domain-containing protein [Sphingobium yanoikuyae]